VAQGLRLVAYARARAMRLWRKTQTPVPCRAICTLRTSSLCLARAAHPPPGTKALRVSLWRGGKAVAILSHTRSDRAIGHAAMGRIEKTVFISYRRTDAPWAVAVLQNLTQHGYDVFIDYDGIASGSFETAILENIKARAHFLVLLTPTALEHCGDPKDWMRREIEAALDSQRNIVPLMLAGFDFGTPATASQLIGKLAALKEYNGLEIPKGYFSPAMERLRDKFLGVSLDTVLHPASLSAQQVAKEQKDKATGARQGEVLETADDSATEDLDEIRKILNEQARIKVVRYITSGEISDVYLGRYGTRLMAIKAIDAAKLSSSDHKKLEKEIELGSSLRDPAFLRLCQVIFHKKRCFIVTDFFDGETITQKIQQGPVFSTGDVIEILYQLSGGIAEAHARGMQYLRITPSDIFVHSDKILDRQVVRLSPINFKYFIENLRLEYEVRWRDGSGPFTAPELWHEPSDQDDDTPIGSMHQKANQFALGMLAWMMLEGQMPIAIPQRGTALLRVGAFLKASKSFRQLVLDSKWRGQARALGDIVATMVSADPERRWKDMKQVNLLIGALTEKPERNVQDIVRNVYQSVCEGKPAFYARFYKNFFRRAPQLEKMFPSDMNRQHQMLHLALSQLLNYVPGQLEPTTLSQFVDRHSRLRLVAEDFTQFGEALIETFEFELRGRAERDSTITALETIIWHGINYLIQKCTCLNRVGLNASSKEKNLVAYRRDRPKKAT
jgi:serine/threonine protein kinase